MKNFDFKSAWKDVKIAYVITSLFVGIMIIAVFSIVIPRVTSSPSRPSKELEEMMHERFKAGIEYGLKQAHEKIYTDTQREIAFRLFLAGFDKSDTETLIGQPKRLCDYMNFEKHMTDKQLVDVAGMRIFEINRLRDLGAKFNPNDEQIKENIIYRKGIEAGKIAAKENIASRMLIAGFDYWQINNFMTPVLLEWGINLDDIDKKIVIRKEKLNSMTDLEIAEHIIATEDIIGSEVKDGKKAIQQEIKSKIDRSEKKLKSLRNFIPDIQKQAKK